MSYLVNPEMFQLQSIIISQHSELLVATSELVFTLIQSTGKKPAAMMTMKTFF